MIVGVQVIYACDFIVSQGIDIGGTGGTSRVTKKGWIRHGKYAISLGGRVPMQRVINNSFCVQLLEI